VTRRPVHAWQTASMAEKDLETEKLELSLFRRKRKKGKEDKDDKQDSGTEVDTPTPEASESAGTAGTAASDASTADAPTAETPAAETPDAPAAASTGGPAAAPSSGTDDTQVIHAAPTTGTQTAQAPRRTRGARVASKQPRRQVQLPSLSAQPAVLLVGAVVGVLAVVLTFVSLQLCELVTGTSSCGGPGLFVLLAVVILMILGGSAALSAFGVQDPGGISFLGVAMFVAVCLVVLLPSLLEPWMIAVAPVLCALSFATAHWIVTRFDEDILESDGPPLHDVR
jgi:hypothetical protein